MINLSSYVHNHLILDNHQLLEIHPSINAPYEAYTNWQHFRYLLVERTSHIHPHF